MFIEDDIRADVEARRPQPESLATFQPSRSDAKTVAAFAAFGPEKHRRAQVAAAEWRANPQLRGVSLEDHIRFSVPGVCDRPFNLGKPAPAPAQFGAGSLYDGQPFDAVRPSTSPFPARDDGTFDDEAARSRNEELIGSRAKYFMPLVGEVDGYVPSGRAELSYPSSLTKQQLFLIEDRDRRDRELVEQRIRMKKAQDAMLEALAAKERKQREEKRAARDLAERQAEARDAHRTTWR
jgi:hypothetical protein